MKLNQLSEVTFAWYQQGKPDVKGKTFRQEDIQQATIMGYANVMRNLYYANKKLQEGDEYYFYSGDLSTIEFPLSEPNIQGMRSATISQDVVRLPKNVDITNVYPVGECQGINGEITQVKPAEENFYLTPQFADFWFFVQKGNNLNTYHLPPCIKSISVERIFIFSYMEISVDVAFDVFKEVVNTILGIKVNWDKDQIEVRKKLENMEGVG